MNEQTVISDPHNVPSTFVSGWGPTTLMPHGLVEMMILSSLAHIPANGELRNAAVVSARLLMTLDSAWKFVEAQRNILDTHRPPGEQAAVPPTGQAEATLLISALNETVLSLLNEVCSEDRAARSKAAHEALLRSIGTEAKPEGNPPADQAAVQRAREFADRLSAGWPQG